MAGRQGIEPCKVGFGVQPVPRTRPRMEEGTGLDPDSWGGATRFPGVAGDLPGLPSMVAGSGRVELPRTTGAPQSPLSAELRTNGAALFPGAC